MVTWDGVRLAWCDVSESSCESCWLEVCRMPEHAGTLTVECWLVDEVARRMVDIDFIKCRCRRLADRRARYFARLGYWARVVRRGKGFGCMLPPLDTSSDDESVGSAA